MLIALGTPRILTERINRQDGGFQDFKTSNSNSADYDNDPSIIVIRRNLARALFVTITYSSISLWSVKVLFIPIIISLRSLKFYFQKLFVPGLRSNKMEIM